jgi:hypothetical protein
VQRVLEELHPQRRLELVVSLLERLLKRATTIEKIKKFVSLVLSDFEISH